MAAAPPPAELKIEQAIDEIDNKGSSSAEPLKMSPFLADVNAQAQAIRVGPTAEAIDAAMLFQWMQQEHNVATTCDEKKKKKRKKKDEVPADVTMHTPKAIVPGTLFTAMVEIDVLKDMKVRAIRCQVQGIETIPEEYDRKDYSINIKHAIYGRERGDFEGDDGEIKTSKLNFFVTFPLADNLPPTFKRNNSVHVKYNMKVTIEFPWTADIVLTQILTVVGSPQVLHPSLLIVKKHDSQATSGCMSETGITGSIQFAEGQYMEQPIKSQIQIANPQQVALRKIRVQLVQVVHEESKYYVIERSNRRLVASVDVEYDKDKMNSDKSVQKEVSLAIPVKIKRPIVPSFQGHTIDVKYMLRLTAIPWFAANFVVESPIRLAHQKKQVE